jgi:hypothetical protein
MMLAESANAVKCVNRSKILLVRPPIRGMSMNRELALKIALAVVGLLFIALGYPMVVFIRQDPVNIIGSCVATIVVAKWEKAFDTEQAAPVLGNSRINS